ncbi:MAG: hypothetical protein A2136_08940 [Chloroflexi bacterium RBG_16_54_11]|nr:MAG: hypothetical protein A2136_08940 [Chloroflexi bacterium RBG_16_54_11]
MIGKKAIGQSGIFFVKVVQENQIPSLYRLNPICQGESWGKWVDKLHPLDSGRVEILTENHLDMVHARHSPYLGIEVAE